VDEHDPQANRVLQLLVARFNETAIAAGAGGDGADPESLRLIEELRKRVANIAAAAERRVASVVAIQAWGRGAVVRRSLWAKMRRHKSALRIQRMFRNWHSWNVMAEWRMIALGVRALDRVEAEIQTAPRASKRTREAVAARGAQWRSAGVRMQSGIRALQAKREANLRRRALAALQGFARGTVTRWRLRGDAALQARTVWAWRVERGGGGGGGDAPHHALQVCPRAVFRRGRGAGRDADEGGSGGAAAKAWAPFGIASDAAVAELLRGASELVVSAPSFRCGDAARLARFVRAAATADAAPLAAVAPAAAPAAAAAETDADAPADADAPPLATAAPLAATAAAAAAPAPAGLKTLLLYGAKVADNGVVALAALLERPLALETLGLGRATLGAAGTRALATRLGGTKEPCPLKKLYLEHVDVMLGRGGLQGLLLQLQRNTRLENLVMRGVRLGDGGAAELGRMLAINASITHLNLHGNSITAKGVLLILAAARRRRKFCVLSALYVGGQTTPIPPDDVHWLRVRLLEMGERAYVDELFAADGTTPVETKLRVCLDDGPLGGDDDLDAIVHPSLVCTVHF